MQPHLPKLSLQECSKAQTIAISKADCIIWWIGGRDVWVSSDRKGGGMKCENPSIDQ